MQPVNTVNNIASENVDFSMFALFMSADLVVKSVIIILILALVFQNFLDQEMNQSLAFPKIK